MQKKDRKKKNKGCKIGKSELVRFLVLSDAFFLVILGAMMLSVGLFRLLAQIMGALDALKVSPVVYDLAACLLTVNGALWMRTGRKTLIEPMREERRIVTLSWPEFLIVLTAAVQAVGMFYVREICSNPYVHHIETGVELTVLLAFCLEKEALVRRSSLRQA